MISAGKACPITELADFLAELAKSAGLPDSLQEKEVPKASLPQLAEEAAKQWTATFNPIAVTVDDLLGLYEQAY